MSECSGDLGEIWKNIKSFLGWTTEGPPSKLTQDGKLYTKPADLAKIMNKFFIEKVKKLRKNIPSNLGNPLDKVRELMRNRTCSFNLRPSHPDEIDKIILKLPNSKSCGVDNIDSYVIKLAKNELVPAITHIVNLSIKENKFP